MSGVRLILAACMATRDDDRQSVEMDTQAKRRTYSIDELLRGPATIPVPEGGRYIGLGRSASYEAARRGILPTLKVGERRVVVPSARLAQLLGADLVSQGGDARAAPAA